MKIKQSIRKTSFGTYIAYVEDEWENAVNFWNTESNTEEECQKKVDKAHFSQEWMEKCLESHKNLLAATLSVDCRAIH